MNKPNYSPRRCAAGLLLALLPLAAAAQNSLQDSLLRSGNLVGGRPHASPTRVARPAGTTTRAAVAAAPNADPVLARLLHESVDLSRVPASQLPDLYDRFVDATDELRRQWSASDWAEANAAFSRLNGRYEAVRQELPLADRLKIRGYQSDFYTMQAARAAKDRLNGKRSS